MESPSLKAPVSRSAVAERSHAPFAFPALLVGGSILALGPWLVRLSGTGPVAAGFWRLALALPFLFIIAWAAGQKVHWPGARAGRTVILAGLFFAADLAAWHAGIRLTRLGNATLFGNISSFAFAAWGLWLVRRWPSRMQAMALLMAAGGVVLLMRSSAELSVAHFHGDLLALGAGLLYSGYLIGVDRARATVPALPVLFLSSATGAMFLLPLALALGERIVPADWTFVLLLALSSQVVGQGLLVYALGSLPPIVIGLTLLTQPAISAWVGWLAYGETLRTLDWIGAALLGGALVLVRLPDRDLHGNRCGAS